MIRYVLALCAMLFAFATPAHAETAAQLGIRCDGKTNDTAAFLAAAKKASSIDLPAGTCLYSRAIIFTGRTNFAFTGKGKDLTILKALDPLQSSVIVLGGDTVRLAGFTVQSIAAPPKSGYRTSDPYSKGIFISQGARNVTVTDVRVKDVRGAGILLCGVRGATVSYSEVRYSLADAYHVSCGSRDVTVQNNLAEGVGDDAFASIGLKAESPNRNIAFLDNVAINGFANCAHFDTTWGGKALRNKCTSMGGAGVAVSSDAKWSNGSSDGIEAAFNVIEGSVTRTLIGYGSISLYSTNGSVQPLTNINIHDNIVKNPASGPAVRAWGKAKITAAATGNTFCNVKKDFAILSPTVTISRSNNKMLGAC